jgi:hypothetical protein
MPQPCSAVTFAYCYMAGNGSIYHQGTCIIATTVAKLQNLHTVVHTTCCPRSPALLQGLGWSSRPAGALLGTQLAALGAKYPAVLLHGKASSTTSSSEPQLAVLAPDLAQQLASGVPALYSALASLPADEMAAAAGVLQGGNSVWVGNGFAPASKVAFKVRAQLVIRDYSALVALCTLGVSGTYSHFCVIRATTAASQVCTVPAIRQGGVCPGTCCRC